MLIQPRVDHPWIDGQRENRLYNRLPRNIHELRDTNFTLVEINTIDTIPFETVKANAFKATFSVTAAS